LSSRIFIDTIKEFLKKISGVRWYLIYNIDENKVTIKSPIMSEDKISDLIEISKASKLLIEKTGRVALISSTKEPLVNTIYVKLNGEGVEIEKLESNILLIGIDEKLLNTLSEIFASARRGELIKCNICGKEIHFETYTCPRCGRVVPFIAETCLFCRYDLRYKKCPGHGDVIDYRGRIVKRQYGVILITALISGAILFFTGFVSTIYREYGILLYSLGGLITALLITIGVLSSKPRIL